MKFNKRRIFAIIYYAFSWPSLLVVIIGFMMFFVAKPSTPTSRNVSNSKSSHTILIDKVHTSRFSKLKHSKSR